VTEPLLELRGLYDCARLARELGISRRAAERIMQQVPKVHVDGLRKVYVKAPDVERYLQERTRAA
jgi:hypothetical protein